MQTQLRTLYARFRTLILYVIIGGFCSALDFGIYTLLCHFDLMPYLWANILSVHCGIFCSFFLNRSFNFRVKDKPAQRFLTFYAVGLTGLALSEGLLYSMVSLAGLNPLVCKLFTIVIVALVQFFLNKYITSKTRQA